MQRVHRCRSVRLGRIWSRRIRPHIPALGTVIECGNVVLMVTQIGKECHSGCAISSGWDTSCPKTVHQVLFGDPPPRRFLDHLQRDQGRGDLPQRPLQPRRTLRHRPHLSGCRISGGLVSSFPMDRAARIRPATALRPASSRPRATSGGTGFPAGPHPEATASICERDVPALQKRAVRRYEITPRAMLSRARPSSGRRRFVVNLPGPKAVEETLPVIMPVLDHAVMTMKGVVGTCVVF